MRHRLGPPLIALAAGCVLLAIAWGYPAFADGAYLADTMLRASYRLPELMASYVPGLRNGAQHTLAAAAGVPLLGFLVWVAASSLARPTGPGQAGHGWRVAAWWVIAVAVAAGVFALVAYGTLGGMAEVDDWFATQAAIVLAAVASLLFWLLCLLGTERMIRPAVPAGAFLVRGS